MRRFVIVMTLAAVAVAPLTAALSTAGTRRIQDAATVLTEITVSPEKGIPLDLWNRAACVVVIPSMKKAAFVFGGEYGRGVMSCRRGSDWSAPLFMRLEKGSWGLQIGAQSIDLVLLVMNKSGAEKLLGNKVSLGAEVSVAAGPVGRDARAATDANLKAEILSYSRTQGLFAGINLSGGILRPDADDNKDLYDANVNAREVLLGDTVPMPSVAEPFAKALKKGV
ncbi:MAG TPA: lipid-binding SYLF domain-containing protein [Vicinamibacterales bacterium]